MRAFWPAALLALFTGAAAAQSGPPAGSEAAPAAVPTQGAPQEPLKDIDALRAHVLTCWQPPAGTPDTSVRVRIKLRPDGALDGDPVVVTGLAVSPDTVDAVMEAIRRCAPYRFVPVPYVKRDTVQFTVALRPPVATEPAALTPAATEPAAAPPERAPEAPDEKPAGGGAPTSTETGPSSLTDLNALRERLIACWRPRADSRLAPITVRIRFQPDGALDGEPEILPGRNDLDFKRTAAGLLEAIRRCAPYQFSEISYETWRSIQMAFVPPVEASAESPAAGRAAHPARR